MEVQLKRISHDLGGTTKRIAKLRDEFSVAITDISESWKDEKWRSFLQKHTTEIGPTFNQLVSTLSTAIELFESIAKKVKDPDIQ